MRTCLRGLGTVLAILAAGVPTANAAGIVTHAWMALDAIDRVQTAGAAPASRRASRSGARRRRVPRRRLLDAHARDAGRRLRRGGALAALPSTRTPRRSAATRRARRSPIPRGRARRRSRTSWARPHTAWATRCGTGSSSRTVPGSTSRTCRATSQPSSAPAASRSSSTSSRSPGTRARSGRRRRSRMRPRSMAAFASVGRGDIDPAAFAVGEQLPRASSAASRRAGRRSTSSALERAMPWTSAHLDRRRRRRRLRRRRDRGILRDPLGRLARRRPADAGRCDGALRWAGERARQRLDRRLLAGLEPGQPRRSDAHRGGAVECVAVPCPGRSGLPAERAPRGCAPPA